MPLNEHEQRLLEQMERALYAEDPKLASTLRGASLNRRHRRRLAIGILGILVGLALLVVGVVQTLLLGVAGFLLMLASAWYGLRSGRSGPAAPAEQGPGSTAGPKGAAASPKRAGFMDRLEERWERRRDGDDT